MIFRRILGLLAVLFTLAAGAEQASAAQAYMCAPEISAAARAARSYGGTNSQVPSQTLYILNGQGCALVALADIGYFQSQGFNQVSSQNAIVFNTGVATGTTNFVVGTLPAKAYIQQIIFSNSVASAVTGGISIGTTANGTNVVAAQAVGASTDVAVAQAAILLPVPVTTGLASTINMAAVTAWNSTNVTVTVIYGYY